MPSRRSRRRTGGSPSRRNALEMKLDSHERLLVRARTEQRATLADLTAKRAPGRELAGDAPPAPLVDPGPDRAHGGRAQRAQEARLTAQARARLRAEAEAEAAARARAARPAAASASSAAATVPVTTTPSDTAPSRARPDHGPTLLPPPRPPAPSRPGTPPPRRSPSLPRRSVPLGRRDRRPASTAPGSSPTSMPSSGSHCRTLPPPSGASACRWRSRSSSRATSSSSTRSTTSASTRREPFIHAPHTGERRPGVDAHRNYAAATSAARRSTASFCGRAG